MKMETIRKLTDSWENSDIIKAVTAYDEWLRCHVSSVDALTGETKVVVNRYTAKAIGRLVKAVQPSDSYRWERAVDVYLRERGLA